MSKPFDATLKTLVQDHPEDWLRQAGITINGSVDVIDADLSTVTTQADKVIRVNGPSASILHVELQADADENLDLRVLRYNVLTHERHRLPVLSLLVLVRAKADNARLTGTLRCPSPLGGDTLVFRYQVIRVWQEPPATFLNSGLGLIALAAVSDVAKQDLPAVIQRIGDRLQQEAPPDEAKTLWTAAYILAGLRYSPRTVDNLFQGVISMEASSTYQAILKKGRVEGRVEEAKHFLLLQGEKRFGKPTARTRQAVEAISDINRLEQLSLRLLDVTTWKELLASA